MIRLVRLRRAAGNSIQILYSWELAWSSFRILGESELCREQAPSQAVRPAEKSVFGPEENRALVRSDYNTDSTKNQVEAKKSKCLFF